jgi:hypothetical protein
MDTFEWIKSTFLKLTSKTYPFGFEDGLVKDMISCGIFPQDLKEDKFGNYYYKIGESKTVFTSHLDTACQDQVSVSHRFDMDQKNTIIKTDGKSILGADDKAGVTILLWMIKNKIPGTYYFFYGEEVGCLGSTAASSLIHEFSSYDRMISFDRRGTGSVITHQSSTRTCSDEFAESLSREFNNLGLLYRKDDTGIYTDSAEFVRVISECTNVSVGYYDEHTTYERQDITHLSKLANAVISVKWEDLPTKRDKNKTEYKTYYPSTYSYSSYPDRTPERTPKRTYIDNYDADHCDVDDVDLSDYSKKNRRKRRKWKNNKGTVHSHSKAFYDLGGGNLKEIEIENPNEFVGKYDILKSKFINSTLDKEEIEIIKSQYFDMSDPKDVQYYGYLIGKYCGTTRV